MLSKETLRKKYLDLRLGFEEHYLEKKAIFIRQNLYNFIIRNFSNDKIIGAYYPIKQEVDIVEVYRKLINDKFQLSLPVIQENSYVLQFYKIFDIDNLITGKYNIKAPPTNISVIPDIVIIPLIACDKLGNRLGYGKGYYDYTLSEIKKKHNLLVIAPCYDFQIIDNIPSLSHDQKIDIIITEEEIFCL